MCYAFREMLFFVGGMNELYRYFWFLIAGLPPEKVWDNENGISWYLFRMYAFVDALKIVEWIFRSEMFNFMYYLSATADMPT